ncbi:unnamed protein product [Parnassius apollo]|uniref:(apollo) hypothetical protein n=1 Tax=Parnassius apollo TaxID=110799 RepID=A0A8S3WGM1_PARAO|nr:unnamed protein product [Parnassius apollo]
MEIKEILQNNKQFYQFVYTYENGNCSQKEMVLKKKYYEWSSNLLEQSSHDNQDSMAEDNSSKNQEDEERHENLISSDFKHHWLATTLSFIKDNKLSTLEYPEMPEACTDFIEYIINNSNNKHDIDLPFKPLYASIWEAMTIFKLKYDFLLKSNVRSNNTVQLTLEKNPRKQDGITNKNPEVNKDTPNKSAKHLKERKKMLKKKTAVIDAVPIDFVMDSLKRIVEFLEDEFSASIVFKNVTSKEWKFLLNVKPMVRNRHILITEISPAIIDLLKRINTANLNAFSLVLSDNKFNKNKKERNVTLEKTPKYKTQTSPNNSTQLNRSISRYSPQERNEQPAFDDNSPGNKLLKALTTSSKNDDCTSVSSMEMKSQSTSSVNDIGLNSPSLKSRHTSIERRKISQKPIINFQSAGSVDLTSDENITPTKENWRSSNESVKRGRSHERRHGRMKNKLLEAMSVPLESDIGLRMMRSMGWDGGALGTRGEGIVEPIIPDLGIITGAGLGHSAVPKRCAESLKRKKKISRTNSISRSEGDENEKTATEEDLVQLTESKYEKNKIVKTRLKIFGEILELLCSDVMNKTVVFEKKLHKNEKKFLKPAIRSFNNRSKISFTIKEECDLIDKIQNEMLSNRAVVIEANFSKAGRELLLSKTINKIDLQIPIMKRLEKRTKYISDNDTQNYSQTDSAPRMKILSVDKFMSSMDSMESYGVYNEKSFKALSCRLMMLEEILEFIEKDESEKAYYIDNHTINYLKFVKKFITSINARKKDKQITAIEDSVAEQILNSLGNSYLVFECDRRLKQMKLKKVVYENKLMNSSKSEPTLLNEFDHTTSDLASTNKNEEVEASQSKNVVQHDIYERVACIFQDMNTKDVKKDDLNERELSNKDVEMIDLTSDNISVTSSENHLSVESDEVPKHIKELENPILKAEVDVCTSKR